MFDFDKAEKEAISKILSDANVLFDEKKLDQYKSINENLWEKFQLKLINQNRVKSERFKLFFNQIDCKADYKRASENYLVYLSQGSELLPYAEDIIFDLKKNHKLGLLTNGISIVQHTRLKNSKLKNIFDAVVVSGDVGVSKPDPEIFKILTGIANYSEKQNMLIIGDSLTSDIQGGINFGIDTCWYNPNKYINTLSIQPTYEISDLRILYDIVNQNR